MMIRRGRYISRQPIRVTAAGVDLEGILAMPQEPGGLVISALVGGGGLYRLHEERLARELCSGGMGVLMMNLLTPEEEAMDMHAHHMRFNVALLARRLACVTERLRESTGGNYPLGYHACGTGVAAAIACAARSRAGVHAVAARAGRPDLAGAALAKLRAPLLLIVGGNDFNLLDLNREALECVTADRKLAVVPGAERHFERPQEMRKAAGYAKRWFASHLSVEEAVPEELLVSC